MSTTVINRSLLRMLRPKITEALVEVGKKHGVELTATNASFTGITGHFKIEIDLLDSSGKVLDREAEAFKLHATSYGLKAENLGQTFFSNGKPFTICGLNPRAHKFSILAKDSKGEIYKFTAHTVKIKLGDV